MDALKAKTTSYQNQLIANEARMRQPQNKAVLDRAQFLNQLFAKKSFSWTAVMMDLENVLPAGVQVTSIEPLISKEGEVSIRLRVSGDRDRAVELVRNLEAVAAVFAAGADQRVDADESGESGRAGAGGGVPGGVEFDILSGYNPLPVVPGAPASACEQDGGGCRTELRLRRIPYTLSEGARLETGERRDCRAEVRDERDSDADGRADAAGWRRGRAGGSKLAAAGAGGADAAESALRGSGARWCW